MGSWIETANVSVEIYMVQAGMELMESASYILIEVSVYSRQVTAVRCNPRHTHFLSFSYLKFGLHIMSLYKTKTMERRLIGL